MLSTLFCIEHLQGNALTVLENFHEYTKRFNVNTLAGSLNGT